MAKSKHAPALFEVINNNKEGSTSGKLQPPKWWKPTAKTGSEQVTGHQEASSQTKQQEVTIKKPTSAGSQTPELDPSYKTTPSQPQTRPGGFGTMLDDDGPTPPVFRFNQGRVELSLNTVSAIVAVGVLLLALFTSYQLGRSLSGAQQPTEISGIEAADSVEEALQAKPNEKVLDVNSPPRKAERATTNAPRPARAGIDSVGMGAEHAAEQSPKQASGQNYVILESFKPSHYKDAEHMQTWLAEKKNLLTTLNKRNDGRWILKSVRRFDNMADLQEYCKMVQAFGQEYKEAFGTEVRYDLRAPFGAKEDG